jgi:hypothetical protein
MTDIRRPVTCRFVIALNPGASRADNGGIGTVARLCAGSGSLESIMSISSISHNFISMVSTPSASASVANVSAAANDTVTRSKSCEGQEPRRRNVLYDAMMSALRELGLTPSSAKPGTPDAAAATPSANAPATPTTPTTATPATTGAAPAATAATGATAPTTTITAAASGTTPAASAAPPSIEDAVLSFAHALWQALRGGDGDSRRGRGDEGEDDGRRAHHHHHHHHRQHDRGGVGRDYSGLASRIEALAVRFDSQSNPIPATQTEPAAITGSAAVPASAATPGTLPGVDPVTDSPVNAVSEAATATATGVPAAPAKNSLAQAFAAMLKVLRGEGSASAGTTLTPEASLASFLHTLARGLDGDRSTPAMSAVGGMINVSA